MPATFSDTRRHFRVAEGCLSVKKYHIIKENLFPSSVRHPTSPSRPSKACRNVACQVTHLFYNDKIAILSPDKLHGEKIFRAIWGKGYTAKYPVGVDALSDRGKEKGAGDTAPLMILFIFLIFIFLRGYATIIATLFTLLENEASE